MVVVLSLMFAAPASAHYVSSEYRYDVSSCSQVPNQQCSESQSGGAQQQTQSDTTEQESSSSASGGSSNSNVNASCESSGDITAVDPSGQYRGKYQFDRSTWRRFGGAGDPAEASEAEQDRIASKVTYDAWPNC